jgi:hypothetical protein
MAMTGLSGVNYLRGKAMVYNEADGWGEHMVLQETGASLPGGAHNVRSASRASTSTEAPAGRGVCAKVPRSSETCAIGDYV